MIYRVRHTTRYAYGSSVDLAAHIFHLRPRALPFQQVLESSITTTPEASRRRDGFDHFGNAVTWLFIDTPHDAFEVTGTATVEVRYPAPPTPGETPDWALVAAAARQGGPGAWQAAEYLFDSPMCAAVAAAGAYAAPSFPAGRPILEALIDLNSRIRKDFTFRGGVTDLRTTVGEVLRRREGVCQDFTHVMISALRSLGLPARYVSGYIRTRPPAGQARLRGADQSHAWVGAWLGPAHGWVDLDPTNNIIAQEEHVVLGWGRDYGDISPVRGVVLGGGDHGLKIEVDLEPVEEKAEA